MGEPVQAIRIAVQIGPNTHLAMVRMGRAVNDRTLCGVPAVLPPDGVWPPLVTRNGFTTICEACQKADLRREPGPRKSVR